MVRHTQAPLLGSEDEEDELDDDDASEEVSASRMYVGMLLWPIILLKSVCEHRAVIFMEKMTATPQELMCHASQSDLSLKRLGGECLIGAEG